MVVIVVTPAAHGFVNVLYLVYLFLHQLVLIADFAALVVAAHQKKMTSIPMIIMAAATAMIQ